jgi:hypothetical protein
MENRNPQDAPLTNYICHKSPDQKRTDIEPKTERLIDLLLSRNFDTVEELITIYRTGDLNDKDKIKIIMELLQYQYPKRKMVEFDGVMETRNLNVISEIVFRNEEIQN